MTLIIISGGIDLSVGSMTAFVGGVTIFFLNVFPGDSVLAVVLASIFSVIFGGICGLFNGLLVTKGRIAPFIATLGTMSIFRSLIQYFSGAGNVVSENIHYAYIGSAVYLGFHSIVLHHCCRNPPHCFEQHLIGRYACAGGPEQGSLSAIMQD